MRTDILVAGNGPAGMAAALALSAAGFEVVIAAPRAKKVDQRTTTLMMPAINFLEKLGVWEEIASAAAPLSAMRIIDATSRLVRARTVTFQALEIGETSFGWNMPNSVLNAALLAKIEASKNIQIVDHPITSYEIGDGAIAATLTNGSTISAKLVAGADGRQSIARAAANIETKSWSYPQTAFVTLFEHRLPHQNVSTEFHTESGPCVQVPLPGNCSSLVWVVSPEKAEGLMALEDAALSLEIEARLSSILGKVAIGRVRQAYPLSGQYPLKFAQNRIALLGEAAHVFPPIGAQGLNLGMRDVQDLCTAASENPLDPGAASVLSAYDRARRPDILARTSAVDTLNRSLLSSLLPAQIARSFGLAVLDMTPPLRSLFMREGMRPGSGFNALFGSIGESIRRKIPLRDSVK